jgi:hypothetical protein
MARELSCLDVEIDTSEKLRWCIMTAGSGAGLVKSRLQRPSSFLALV